MELLFGDTARVICQKGFLFVCPCDFICCSLNERKICSNLTNVQSEFAPTHSVGTCVCFEVHPPLASMGSFCGHEQCCL